MEGWLEGSAAPTPAQESGSPLPSLCLEGTATGRLGGGVSGRQGHPLSFGGRLPSLALFQPNGHAWSARRDQQVTPAGPTSEFLDAAPGGGGSIPRVGVARVSNDRGTIVSWAHGITGVETFGEDRGRGRQGSHAATPVHGVPAGRAEARGRLCPRRPGRGGQLGAPTASHGGDLLASARSRSSCLRHAIVPVPILDHSGQMWITGIVDSSLFAHCFFFL